MAPSAGVRGPAIDWGGAGPGRAGDERGVDGNPLALGLLALLATYVWTYASLAAVQLTVRLILRFDLLETARAAVWLSAAVIVVGALLLWLTGQAIDPAAV